MSNFNIHPSFLLNGISFETPLELISFSEGVSDDLYWFLQEWFSDSETLIVKTSGSTGTPKLVAIKKEFMINSAKATGTFFELGTGIKALCCLSTEYIAGKMMVIRALTLGWELDIIEPISNPLEDAFEVYDFCAMVPMQAKASLWDLHLVKKLLIGGGVVSNELQESLQHISSLCYASYGMTETVSHVAVKPLNGFRAELRSYQLLPNITISQDDRDCLVIDAPLLSEEIVITNDIVKVHSATEFEWIGRYDNVINSGGVKLHPEQIEKELSKIITERFFVAGISDEVLGEKLILIVEGDSYNLNLNNINLSKYELPKHIYFTPRFMVTKTNKIQRQKTLALLTKLN
ncbi:O-succinylbenzoic acid--CoA ligase [Wenyingzhuangia heitensis]|uniref:O-succinylbenzoic acid--CoA ligase n=1 Tax=Wenyingzhuangia heitensis TaxID=1487859 RepID=A0ABX0UGI7_9FLAO|nr:AMP-binding protein [Wenyingzhuangia heitensis]NIJ46306.1 O-succinylbenzoic acid--CoA ligase [Wenyingzhuangia heitensis]